MNITKTRIITDSSSDIIYLDGISFASAPLKIVTSERQYLDDASLDVAAMVQDLRAYSGKSSTSCPNTEDYLSAFGDAEEIFCITITATLSGSYNSACLAARSYMDSHPERRVHVINSLSTGPEMKLIVEKLSEYIRAELDFDEAVRLITEYTEHTGLIFMLESLKNLANNGRVNPLIAKVAGMLGIRVIGRASAQGDLEQLAKSRGEKKAVETVYEKICEGGYSGGRLRISSCLGDSAAQLLCATVRTDFPESDIEIYPCRGLCSFYAEMGGMLVGFEKGEPSL